MPLHWEWRSLPSGEEPDKERTREERIDGAEERRSPRGVRIACAAALLIAAVSVWLMIGGAR